MAEWVLENQLGMFKHSGFLWLNLLVSYLSEPLVAYNAEQHMHPTKHTIKSVVDNNIFHVYCYNRSHDWQVVLQIHTVYIGILYIHVYICIYIIAYLMQGGEAISYLQNNYLLTLQMTAPAIEVSLHLLYTSKEVYTLCSLYIDLVH